jgi:hypothetical protein
MFGMPLQCCDHALSFRFFRFALLLLKDSAFRNRKLSRVVSTSHIVVTSAYGKRLGGRMARRASSHAIQPNIKL